MASPLLGIHHVTALAKQPQANLDFYTRTLGLRFIKRTVNFDDPMTYHLYYGDADGSPGTILTHFPHPYAKRSVHGTPEIARTLLAVPRGSLGYWEQRLAERGAAPKRTVRFGEQRLDFDDHDSMSFSMVERETDESYGGFAGDDVEVAHAVRCVDAVAIHVDHADDVDATAAFLRETLGFAEMDTDGSARRLALPGARAAASIELIADKGGARSVMGAGTVHHVAWRVPDTDAHNEVIDRLRAVRVGTTPVIDRQYFRSIYFRIPAGVIFEVATDGPGFTVDEPAQSLGSALTLPPQHQPRRAEIEAHLHPLDTAHLRPGGRG